MHPPHRPTQGQAQDSENLQSYGTTTDQHLQLGEPSIQVQGAAAAVPPSLLTVWEILHLPFKTKFALIDYVS